MGLAASQARLLTITSRLSSVELRQQRIAMDKMRLANDSESVSEKYTKALNNKTLSFSNGSDNNIPLTYSLLEEQGYSVVRASDGLTPSAPDLNNKVNVNTTPTPTPTTNKNTNDEKINDSEILKWVGKPEPTYPDLSEDAPVPPTQKLSEPAEPTPSNYVVNIPSFADALAKAETCADYSYNYTTSNRVAGSVNYISIQQQAQKYKYNLDTSVQNLITSLTNAGLTSTADTLKSSKQTADKTYQTSNISLAINMFGYGQKDKATGKIKTPENTYAKTLQSSLTKVQNLAKEEADNIAIAQNNTINNANNQKYQADLKAYQENKNAWDTYNSQKTEYDAKNKEILDQYYKDYNNWQAANNTSSDEKQQDSITPVLTNTENVNNTTTVAQEFYQQLQNSGFLIQGLLSGYLTLVKDGQQVSLSSATDIIESYDKTDDAAAEAEYNAQMNKINRKEKILDMQARRLDTEYSALTTEYNSIKSIIQNHTQKDFSYFS